MTSTANSDPKDSSFSTAPDRYHHLKLTVQNDEACIKIDVNPEKNLRGDTPLKLNSYDLGVDIELADAINRLRFEHPQVRLVTITSLNDKIFSSGANIYMLKKSSHAFKVNFCKFTNETRLYLEEASKFSGQKYLCAVNGTAAGGGYELALACDRIILIDDKFANVSLPEVPLLGVLPGTGGLTRVVDKRKIRRDIADVFCSTSEGAKGKKAKAWNVVDEIYAKTAWEQGVKLEGAALKNGVAEKNKLVGVTLANIEPTKSASGYTYKFVNVQINDDRTIDLTIAAPSKDEPTNPQTMMEEAENLWLMRAFRELDDALLRIRFFHREHGLLKLHTKGDQALVLAAEKPLYDALKPNAHWFLRELLLQMGRVFKRLDLTSKTIVSLIEPGTCFAGCLSELLLASDRTYALDCGQKSATISLSPLNQGFLVNWSKKSRLESRFYGHEELLKQVHSHCDGRPLNLEQANILGLVTFLLDDIDYDDEVRVFIEERASLSPDALTAMEANLRFVGPETMATKIFGRLSAWQNWVFTRDNATGDRGALISYGEDKRPQFNFERC